MAKKKLQPKPEAPKERPKETSSTPRDKVLKQGRKPPESFQELREHLTEDCKDVMAELLKRFGPIDGYAVAVVKNIESRDGITMNLGSDLGENLFSVEAAADLAAKAIANTMTHFGMSWAEASANFQIKVFEKYKVRSRKSCLEDLEKALMNTAGELKADRLDAMFKGLPPAVLERMGPPPESVLRFMSEEEAKKAVQAYETRLAEIRKSRETKPPSSPNPVA